MVTGATPGVLLSALEVSSQPSLPARTGRGELRSVELLAKPAAFAAWCRKSGRRKWVVYAKRPSKLEFDRAQDSSQEIRPFGDRNMAAGRILSHIGGPEWTLRITMRNAGGK